MEVSIRVFKLYLADVGEVLHTSCSHKIVTFYFSSFSNLVDDYVSTVHHFLMSL